MSKPSSPCSSQSTHHHELSVTYGQPPTSQGCGRVKSDWRDRAHRDGRNGDDRPWGRPGRPATPATAPNDQSASEEAVSAENRPLTVANHDCRQSLQPRGRWCTVPSLSGCPSSHLHPTVRGDPCLHAQATRPDRRPANLSWDA